jgi:hypothetical protein
MGEGENVPPTTEETVKEEQHLPTTEERLEHCYDEIGALRAEIAELRSHSHPELAHATHEHDYAHSGHTHEITVNSERTEEPSTEHQEGGDSTPSVTHPYFRKVIGR